MNKDWYIITHPCMLKDPWISVSPLHLLVLLSMSLLSHFWLNQGLGGGTPSHGQHQGGGLYSSSPFQSPAGTHISPHWGSQLPPQYSPESSPSLQQCCSSSGDNMAHEHSTKWNRRFVIDICREYQLEYDTLDTFAAVSIYFLVSTHQ